MMNTFKEFCNSDRGPLLLWEPQVDKLNIILLLNLHIHLLYLNPWFAVFGRSADFLGNLFRSSRMALMVSWGYDV